VACVGLGRHGPFAERGLPGQVGAVIVEEAIAVELDRWREPGKCIAGTAIVRYEIDGHGHASDAYSQSRIGLVADVGSGDVGVEAVVVALEGYGLDCHRELVIEANVALQAELAVHECVPFPAVAGAVGHVARYKVGVCLRGVGGGKGAEST
jgi:hypothetical protein